MPAKITGRLGGATPAATTLTDAYTVPAARAATCRAICANRGAATTVRVTHAPNGAADAPGHYLVYDAALAAGESKVIERIMMDAADTMRVWAGTADVTFNVNGIEEDA